MSAILITTLVITVIGIVVGFGLVATSRKFHVEVDERVAAVRAALPGNNCGACGFAGCDAMAAAIVKGDAPVNGCPVGNEPVANAIGAIMGVKADEVIRGVAFVRCKGDCNATSNQANYVGEGDCRTAQFNGIRFTSCDYGCLGLGSCVKVCPEHAISVKDGVAVVNPFKCVGCGLCVKTCPRGLIELVPENRHIAVQCRNQDKGPVVRKVCSAGCIGCMLCTKLCPTGAITVTNNVAHIDYEKCVECGACAEKCPAKVITTRTLPDDLKRKE